MQNLIAGISLLLVGAACNLLVTMWFFHWKKRQDMPADLDWRIARLEDAFIAHTGETLNGKSYKKEH